MELGIREAALETGISAHTLRYYERIGLIVDVPRDDAGHRRYGDDELRWIDFLTKLRSTGMPIQQMLRYAELLRMGRNTVEERTALLEAHRADVAAHIAELQAHLAVLDHKIANYKAGVYG